MSYTESEADCDDCGSQIGDGEECYCSVCTNSLRNQIEELTETNGTLSDKVDELENKVSDLESENISAEQEVIE